MPIISRREFLKAAAFAAISLALPFKPTPVMPDTPQMCMVEWQSEHTSGYCHTSYDTASKMLKTFESSGVVMACGWNSDFTATIEEELTFFRVTPLDNSSTL